MKNISLYKEPLELAVKIKYIVIDALYINEIKLKIANLTSNNILSEIRNTVFTYTDTPFAEYMSMENVFTIDKIKKVDYDQINSDNSSMFSVDSGVMVFINEKIFINFISKFDYVELVDSSTELLNVAYWSFIANDFNLSDTAVIVSPGINSSIEFDGSGTYKIV